jgi:hypothetical protein
LLALEKEGLAFLEEVGDLVANLEPVNSYDRTYREQLKSLWTILDRNHCNHRIIPERQKLPRVESVRRGMPYMLQMPADRDKYSPG